MTPTQEVERKEILTLAHRDHEKGLNAHAYYKIGDHATGEDLVQDTFLKTWKYLVRDGKIDVMRAFLYRILNCLIIDEYRKRKTISLEVLVENGFEPAVDHGTGVRLLDFLDGKKAVFLIGELSEKYQKVMRMRYVRGLSLAEIALITGQSKNTLAVQTYRGLAKLKILYNRV